MKILWVCNIMLPFVAEALGCPASNKEGWLTGIAKKIIENADAGVKLAVCFPVEDEKAYPMLMTSGGNPIMIQDVECYGFVENTRCPETYDVVLESRFEEILADCQPDLIHCFGTEFGHTYAALKAFGKPERSLVGIQGLCAAYAKVYMADVPQIVQKRWTLRDFLRKDNLVQQQRKFVMRGERENQALRLTGNITGRTTFDREETYAVNPKARYLFMNETLRSNFYEGAWCLEDCERYSIFISQGNYPIKGLHYMLKAMAKLRERYPDCKLYVAGDIVTAYTTWKEKLKISSYGKYLLDLIHEFRLEEAVVFLGKLDAEAMKKQFLKSHVHVLASALENSPNSLGEAMLLGVPCVASEVGGVPDMMLDGVEGLTYPKGNCEQLVACISRVFDNDEFARQISESAARRARVTHNGDANYRRLIEIYEIMMES
ncbi:MAG: glycosyltransferase family 4 protein [Lachnospiraceae bacterium]|nr:glycosyltransferase family 4 protein [Lachnospiraceae bacterium]